MSKVAVIFEGKYGTTEQYAKWICEETGGNLFQMGQVKAAELSDYDTIVFGGAIHAGGILGMDKFRKLYPQIQDKQILTFAVGLNTEDEAARAECRELNFQKRESSLMMLVRKGVRIPQLPNEERDRFKNLPCYFFRGAYDPAKVSGMDKTVMGVVRRMISGKAESERSQSEQELLLAVKQGADFVDRKYIEPLVAEIKGRSMTE